jgi:hypothetical protein
VADELGALLIDLPLVAVTPVVGDLLLHSVVLRRPAGEHPHPYEAQMSHPAAGVWPRRAVLAAALVVTTSACGRATNDHSPVDDQAGPTGIKGITNVDAGCPPSPDATPCPYRPLAARLRFIRQDRDAPDVEMRTGDDGTFTVELPPGRYHVEPDNLTGAPYPYANPLTVEVRRGEFTTITVNFDSGVR